VGLLSMFESNLKSDEVLVVMGTGIRASVISFVSLNVKASIGSHLKKDAHTRAGRTTVVARGRAWTLMSQVMSKLGQAQPARSGEPERSRPTALAHNCA
jgi:hypothetical protein